MDRYKAIVMDLDGTLLRDDKTISCATIRGLREFSKLGKKLIIASGRDLYSIKTILVREGLWDLIDCVIANNGADYFISGKQTFIKKISRDQIERILAELGNLDGIVVYFHYQETIYATNHTAFIEKMKVFNGQTKVKKLSLEAIKKEIEPVRISVYMEKLSQIKIIQSFKFDGLVGVQSHVNIYDFIPEGISKAETLSLCANMLNVHLNEMVAFGDSDNDLEMLYVCGKGVAMRNANQHIVGFANEQTKYTNEEDGVIRHLENIL